jgi:RimJ/RimL family protein N-acetyltransferase
MWSLHAPEAIATARLLLRRPTRRDARDIFARYASDPEVTRYLAWPRHRTLDETAMFLDFSDREWRRHGCGPYLVFSNASTTLLGSTGLTLEGDQAQTGYVFARDAWGHGYATESLQAMVALAAAQGLERVYALCHVDHRASAHVLEKCGFVLEGDRDELYVFPNISSLPQGVRTYAKTFQPAPLSVIDHA